MLTKVILEGPLGKKFGRVWNLSVESPQEALRMIEANVPGVFSWIKSNLDKYSRYRVLVKHDGKTKALDSEEYAMLNSSPSEIRFVPIIEGAGAVGKVVIGALLVVASFYAPGPMKPYLFNAGVTMIMGGIIEALTPIPKKQDSARSDQTSYYFDGAANTSMQGVPVPLIYGRIRTGSHAISAAMTIDQMM